MPAYPSPSSGRLFRQTRFEVVAGDFHEAVLEALQRRAAVETGLRASTAGGWHSPPDLHEWTDPAMRPLLHRLQEASRPTGRVAWSG